MIRKAACPGHTAACAALSAVEALSPAPERYGPRSRRGAAPRGFADKGDLAPACHALKYRVMIQIAQPKRATDVGRMKNMIQ
jgi:hypothetical protein